MSRRAGMFFVKVATGQPKRRRLFGTKWLQLGELCYLVRDNLSKFLFEQTKRRPAIPTSCDK